MCCLLYLLLELLTNFTLLRHVNVITICWHWASIVCTFDTVSIDERFVSGSGSGETMPSEASALLYFANYSLITAFREKLLKS